LLAELLRDAGGCHPGVAAIGRIQAGSPARILTETTPSAGLIVTGARCCAPRQRHRQRIGPVVHTLLPHPELFWRPGERGRDGGGSGAGSHAQRVEFLAARTG
jgi:hypothetical protein